MPWARTAASPGLRACMAVVHLFQKNRTQRAEVAAMPDGPHGPGTELPVLTGQLVVLRPATVSDVPALRAILAEPSVATWWGEPVGVMRQYERDSSAATFHDGMLMELLSSDSRPA
jgi:hypothetical protein